MLINLTVSMEGVYARQRAEYISNHDNAECAAAYPPPYCAARREAPIANGWNLMDTRYQVFVSSTFADLVEERQAVMQALLSLDHFPAGMELFPASDEDQWTLIKGVIDDSDYYIIVIAGRYGSLSSEGLSYTEKEFDYALTSGIPILAFLHESPDELPVKKTDQNDEARKKLEGLRGKLQTGRHVKYWKNADDLRAKVIQAVSAETKRNPRTGWIRADQSSDPQRLNKLLQENEVLRLAIQEARVLPPPGTTQYAQGDDVFLIEFSVSAGHAYRGDNIERDLTCEMTWDQILYEVGPLMMDEADERKLRSRLVSELPSYAAREIEGAAKEAGRAFNDVSITDDSFETIKIQLKALGLIRKSTKKHAPTDTKIYWSLTDYGEQYLTGLRAVKREKQ